MRNRLGQPGLTAIFAAALFCASPVAGQNALQPVEPGVEDMGPLDETLRSKEHLLQPNVPEDFAGLYESPEHPERYYRFDRGVTVAFPRSEYRRTEDGTFPTIPAGAVFYIGRPPELRDQGGESPVRVTAYGAGSGIDRSSESSETPPASPNRINGRLSLRVDANADGEPEASRRARLAASAEARDRRPTVWSNEHYRRSRIASLLGEAADADRR